MNTRCSTLIVCALGALPSTLHADTYQFVDTYDAPAGVFDTLPDGRLIALQGSTIVVQDALHAPSYTPIGSVPADAISSFGASFLSLNPSGTTLAIGDNDAGVGVQEVLIVELSALSPDAPTSPVSIPASNFDGAWADDHTLYVSGAATFGAPGTLTRIDTLTQDSTVVMTGLNGASGGVTVNDRVVYTGNGFGAGTGFDATGAIAAFDRAALDSAPSPLLFSDGTLIATSLSAGSLDFDEQGSLIVGGSNVFDGGEGGFIAVIPESAFPNALSFDGQALVPETGAFGFPSALFNGVTDEILVRDGGTIYRYAIPSPGAAALLAFGLGSGRQRRRA